VHLTPEPVPLAHSENGTCRPDTIFELMVLGLVREYTQLGYGLFSLGGNPGFICYYRPGAQLKPLPEWLKFGFIEFVGPVDPLTYEKDMGVGKWKPWYERD
jgi:hypothetical protein